MASSAWKYDAASKRFKNAETGRFLSNARVRQLRDGFVVGQQEAPQELAAALAQGDLTLKQWEKAMRSHVKESFLAEALLGRGGKNAMAAKDYGALGAQVKAQYGFLRDFARDVGQGTLTEAQIAGRSAMYVDAARQAYERARASAFDVSLPAHPADGQTQCLSNCRCSWDYAETETEVQATWVAEADPCPDCAANAEQWAPLVFGKDGGEQATAVLVGANGHR